MVFFGRIPAESINYRSAAKRAKTDDLILSIGDTMAAMATKSLEFWVFALGVSAGTILAQIQEGPRGIKVSISGTLTGLESGPIPGAAIGLTTWDERVWQPLTRSSKSGKFAMHVYLQPGVYRVIAGLGSYGLTSMFFHIHTPKDTTKEVDLTALGHPLTSDGLPRALPPIGELPMGNFEEPERGPGGGGGGGGPPPKPGSQEVVNVFYATNRPAVKTEEGHYDDRPVAHLTMSYGVCKVSIPRHIKSGILSGPPFGISSRFRIPETT